MSSFDRADSGIHSLKIYTISGCSGSNAAREIARNVAGWGFANLEVQVIDLTDPGSIRPRAVFAVPSYVLDGVVISLGNPTASELRDRIDRVVEERSCL